MSSEPGASPEADAAGEACAPQGGDALTRVMAICNKRGLHARASARFVQTAESFDATISVRRDGVCVGGTSIMGLMMLCAANGSTIEVTCSGPEAQAAMQALDELVVNRFGEGE